MGADTFAFSNRVGDELTQLLRTRTQAELAEVSDQERLTAALGAALICVAEVLRDPVAQGARPAPLIEHCAKWLATLLEGVPGRGAH
jgi:hypothetical protein